MKIFRLLSLALFGAGLATFATPVIRVHVPPLASMHYSPWHLTQSAAKTFLNKEIKSDSKKPKIDFFEVLKKILPKDTAMGGKQEFSITFILGALVPVAFVATYLLLLTGFFLRLMKLKFLSVFPAFFSIFTAGYSLIGTYFLGFEAERSFQAAVEKTGSGFLGMITKHLVGQIIVQPDWGLYALCGAAFLVLLASLLPTGD